MTNGKILVIEDDPMNRKLFSALLHMAGHECVIAEDAEKGIAVARKMRPDLILMDIQLPGMDGLSATKLLKDDPGLRDIPVIALTAFAMADDKKRALETGCSDYISKPVNKDAFLEKITLYL